MHHIVEYNTTRIQKNRWQHARAWLMILRIDGLTSYTSSAIAFSVKPSAEEGWAKS